LRCGRYGNEEKKNEEVFMHGGDFGEKIDNVDESGKKLTS
jgi:hypothetical protein